MPRGKTDPELFSEGAQADGLYWAPSAHAGVRGEVRLNAVLLSGIRYRILSTGRAEFPSPHRPFALFPSRLLPRNSVKGSSKGGPHEISQTPCRQPEL